MTCSDFRIYFIPFIAKNVAIDIHRFDLKVMLAAHTINFLQTVAQARGGSDGANSEVAFLDGRRQLTCPAHTQRYNVIDDIYWSTMRISRLTFKFIPGRGSAFNPTVTVSLYSRDKSLFRLLSLSMLDFRAFRTKDGKWPK